MDTQPFELARKEAWTLETRKIMSMQWGRGPIECE